MHTYIYIYVCIYPYIYIYIVVVVVGLSLNCDSVAVCNSCHLTVLPGARSYILPMNIRWKYRK